MIFKMECDSRHFIESLCQKIEFSGIDCASLVSSGEIPVFEKYDDYIPGDLLRKAYATDKLRADEAEKRLGEIRDEW